MTLFDFDSKKGMDRRDAVHAFFLAQAIRC